MPLEKRSARRFPVSPAHKSRAFSPGLRRRPRACRQFAQRQFSFGPPNKRESTRIISASQPFALFAGCLSAEVFIERADLTRLGPFRADAQDDQNGPDASSDHGKDRTEER